MNLGLVTSYIIAGMLMLAIVTMNINLSTSSSDLTLTQITKQHVQTVTDMLTYDIPKIGFAQNGKVTKYNNPDTGTNYNMITIADNNRIRFYSDVDNNGQIDEVTWEFKTSEPVATTNNPNDFKLVRSQRNMVTNVTESTEITLGVTEFVINYYDEYGDSKINKLSTPVANPDNIKQIDIELVMESKEKIRYSVNSDGRYVASAWEKRYTPRNLQ
ncbi:hypothetical protein G3570_09910 [Balneolaceae bacterium YR4-1]|uniref:Uncharacterized protein n=1 Tax=Halalkalibaculum roseum TaxID=2709311 RepID=A0A6M1SXG5_9BACT|nr:hypothetical protein [Halalkalibaculum roseum]NGP76948.1 hypothetical protein [Halalkalibaculum roseum]